MTGLMRNERHNNIVTAIAKQIDEDKKCLVVCADEDNMGGIRDKPDLEFYFEHERYLIDVTFVYDFSTNEARFNQK
jgi:hypothetical protein